jgi:TrkA domain protein
MDVRIHEQNLPGIGHRYDVSVGDDRQLIVVVQRSGRREIGISRRGADEPATSVGLSHDQAVAVAALLTGARFSIESDPERDSGAGHVAIETVTLSERSPAVGRPPREVPLLEDSDATILAVIRNDTPQLLEDDVIEPCRAGDRLVVAARRERLADVVRALAG